MTVDAAIYSRISKDTTGEGSGVARQRAACLELCERRGWTVADRHQFVDNDTSASSARSKRNGFAALLEAIEHREVGAVVVYHVDRLVRRLDELEKVISLCERTGVKLATVSGDLDLSTDPGRLNARILASVARGEVERKSKRQRDANKEAAKNGKLHGGPRRFGYTVGARNLDPDEAPIVAEMYRQFLAGGTLGGLARWLNGQRILTPRGKTWKYNSVRQVLANPANAGLRGVRELLDEEVGGTGRRALWHTIVSEKSESPAIVTPGEWEKAMKIILDPARRTNYVGNRQTYLLSRLARCGECGEKLITGRRDGVRTLRCPTLRHVSRRADYIEEFVTDVILDWLRGPAAKDLLCERSSGFDVEALHTQAAALRDRLKELAADYGAGDMTRQEYQAAREGARKRLAEIDQQIANAAGADVLARFIGGPRDPWEVWEAPETTLEVQRAVIDAVVTVRVGKGRPGRAGQGPGSVPGTVSFEWKGGM